MTNATLHIHHYCGGSVSDEFTTQQKDVKATVHRNGEVTVHFPAENETFQMNLLVYKENVTHE